MPNSLIGFGARPHKAPALFITQSQEPLGSNSYKYPERLRDIASGTYALPSLNMKLSLFVFVCSGLLALVASFTKEDHEIFRLRDEIEASEGPEVTFYGNYS